MGAATDVATPQETIAEAVTSIGACWQIIQLFLY
jgi:hypothetical protein